MSDAVPAVMLNDGVEMPRFGLGVFETPVDQTEQIVRQAIDRGYRLIDTAAAYRNEAGVGEAIRDQPNVFVTTKLWNEQQGYDQTLRAFDRSHARLGRIDLYLIHWPAPSRGQYVESWRAMVELKAQGRVGSIGVSNFAPEHLDRIIDATGVVPVVNQIELHAYFQQRPMMARHAELGIATMAWSPLARGKHPDQPAIEAIAARVGRTPAQVVLRWHMQYGTIAIPKTVNPGRMDENIAIFDFQLSPEDMAAIAALDDADGRIGPTPDWPGPDGVEI
ncbi:MAG: aldo/keto reductase [Sphingobium sp.]